MQESFDSFNSQANSLQANKMCSCDTEDTIIDFIFTVEPPMKATSTTATFFFPQGGRCGEVQLYLQSVVPQNSLTCLYEIFPTLLVDPVKDIVIQAKTFLPFEKS